MSDQEVKVFRKTKDFTQITNQVLRDTRLTFGALGLLCTLLSNASSWVNRVEKIRSDRNMSKAAIQKLFRELKGFGYADLVPIHGPGGTFVGCSWHVYEVPIDREQEKPAAGDPGSIRRPKDKNTKGLLNDEERRGQSAAKQAIAPSFSNEEPQPQDKGGKSEGGWKEPPAHYGRTVEHWFGAAERKALRPKWNADKSGFNCLCPVHEDTNPSFAVNRGHTQAVVAYCRGCKCGIEDAESFLFPVAKNANPENDRMQFVYTDEHGTPLYMVCRTRKKGPFWTQLPTADGWRTVKQLNKIPRRVLYRLHKLHAADPSRCVYVCEGEKDVDRAEGRGLLATCNPFGANNWRAEFAEVLRGRHVVVVRDKDDAGHAWAEAVYQTVLPLAASVRVVETPADKKGADLSDHFDEGYRESEWLEVTAG